MASTTEEGGSVSKLVLVQLAAQPVPVVAQSERNSSVSAPPEACNGARRSGSGIHTDQVGVDGIAVVDKEFVIALFYRKLREIDGDRRDICG